MKKPNEKNLADALRRLDEDVLDDDYPIELVDEELREAGLDPKEVAARGVALAKRLLEAQRGAFRDEALRAVAPLEDRLSAARGARPPRADMLARIAKAGASPRFAASVAAGFRGRRPDEPTDEEVEALYEKLAALGAFEDDDA